VSVTAKEDVMFVEKDPFKSEMHCIYKI